MSIFTTHFDNLYVEPTTYCNLKCPRCPRTFDRSAYKLTHLDIEPFEFMISSPLFKPLRYLEYGGNYGDPTLHPNLDKFFNRARALHSNVSQVLHTNGSRSPEWWESFLPNLTKNDAIMFSVDGLEDTNQIYRINSQWEWIENAIRQSVNHCQVVWKFIVFRHNENQILSAIEHAKSLGVGEFYLTKSSRFNLDNTDDVLAPSQHWVGGRFSREEDKVFTPLCQQFSKHYLAADGSYHPCCWIEPEKLGAIKIRDFIESGRSFEDLISSEALLRLKQDWTNTAEHPCKNICSRNLSANPYTSNSQLKIDLNLPEDKIGTMIDEFSTRS